MGVDGHHWEILDLKGLMGIDGRGDIDGNQSGSMAMIFIYY